VRCFWVFHRFIPSYYQDPAFLLREVCVRCGAKRIRKWPSLRTEAPENPPQITHWGNGLECCGVAHEDRG
jgi:hypothetical protein